MADLINTIHANLPRSKGGVARHSIKCRTGLTLSVQASSFHYCSPRKDTGPYDTFEVGFPSRKIEALMPYAKDADRPTQTVYGWVPAQIIEHIIQENGGVIETGTLPVLNGESAK